VDALAFSPQGDRIVTGTSDGMVRVWPVEGGDPVVFAADGRVEYAHFSPDGSMVSAGIGNGREIRIWPVDGGEPVVVELPGRDLVGGEFFPDGERILTGGRGARIWRTDGTGPIATFPSAADGWGHARMSPDGKHIAVSGGGKISIYEVDAPDSPIIEADRVGSDSWLGRFPDELLSMASLDGSAASSPGHATVTAESGWLPPEDRSWLVRNFAGSARPSVGNGGVRRSPDGTRITADFRDGTVRTWSLHDGGEAIVLRHDAPVNALAFSPDGRQVATGAADGIVRIWSADGSGGPLLLGQHGRWAGNTTPLPWIRRPDGVSSVRFSADGRRLVTAAGDSTVRVWAADGTGEPIVLEHATFMNDAAFSPDGTRIVTGGRDGRVLVWPSDGSGAPAVVRESAERIESVSFDPDGRHVLSASATAQITTLVGEAEPNAFRGSYFVSDAEFSPDGSRVAIASESGDLRIFAVRGEAEPMSLRGEESHIWSVAFGPNGERVVAGTSDGTVRVWRLDGSEEPLRLSGHFEAVTGVAFSADGTRVATSSLDGTVRIWRVTWPELLEYVRANLRACLTVEQRMKYLAESLQAASEATTACERD
jgi:WD40 repeat protein